MPNQKDCLQKFNPLPKNRLRKQITPKETMLLHSLDGNRAILLHFDETAFDVSENWFVEASKTVIC